MNLLYTRIHNLNLPIDLILKLFDHTIIPILTYSSEIIGYENISLYETIQNDFLRKVLNIKKAPLYICSMQRLENTQ
jgi:hypothetical protein